MGIVLARDTSSAESDGRLEASKRSRRTRPTMSDLPFPPADSSKNMEKWRKIFIPALLTWAGTQTDPFGINNMIQEPAEDIWFSVFPDVALNDMELGVVLAVVRSMILLDSGGMGLTVSRSRPHLTIGAATWGKVGTAPSRTYGSRTRSGLGMQSLAQGMPRQH
jgi:hypothetical protein